MKRRKERNREGKKNGKELGNKKVTKIQKEIRNK
jgi:hypothetical protein